MISSRLNRLSLFLCAVLHGMNHALQLLLPPLYLAIRDDFGLSGLSRIMLLGTIYYVTYAASGIPYGFLSDKFNKKTILVIGTLVNCLAFLIAAVTHSYTVFVAAMILGGIGGGSYHPVANALIANLFKNAVGRAYGLIGIGASLGLFLGPAASGYLGQTFGWRTSCIAFALFGCLVAIAFGFIMPQEETEPYPEDHVPIQIKSFVVALLPLILVFGMRDFCLFGTMYLTPAMAQMDQGLSQKAAGLLIGLMSLTGVISQPLAGGLSDRFGRRKMIAVYLALSGVTVSALPFMDGITVFPLAFLAGFMLLGTVPMIDAAAAEIMPPSARGRLFGVLMTLGVMFGAVSPYIAGIIHDLSGGYPVVYLVLGLSGLVGASMTFMISARRPHAS